MSMQDPIADMFTRIRNAQAAGHEKVSFTCSKVKLAILEVLQKQGYISEFNVNNENPRKPVITVILKYFNGKPVIAMLRRISKPGLRQYVGVKEMPEVMEKLGIAIVSTSGGIKTGREAVAAGQGGEILCYVA